ncbi:YceI family protein [Fulvivirga sp. 29W222]|uniref:YceI family protein n=1 Tax=Fulvivirga marina TaxID=2494733 RepID=A0A937G4T6_9BACT|nr:YceI family protein [Fulvivirga marina]MBL6450000.1 YceI family protein [Fulvivirga marina]
MKNLKFLGFAAFVIMAAACSQTKEGTDAEVSEAKEVTEVSTSESFGVNKEESKITWIGSKPTGKHNGIIPIASGDIAIEDNQVVGGTIVINVAEIDNQDLKEDPDSHGKLVGHLKSEDFFDTQNYPTAEFVITSVELYSKEDSVKVKEEFDTQYKPASAKEHMVASPTHKVTGNLTMRGKTLSISFPAHVQVQDNKVIAKAKFNIDRSLWGLQYNNEADVVDKAKDKFIYNTVNVGFDIVANN